MLSVVLFAQGPVDLQQFQGGDPEPLALEPLKDLPNKPPLDRIRLEDNQGAAAWRVEPRKLASNVDRSPWPVSASGNKGVV